jgi:phage-related protein
MATWTWPVASGERVEITPRVRVARFGDGYEQRVADGIHTLARRFSVRLAAGEATVKAADDFLRARGGVEPFDWVALDHRPGRWVCRSWSVAYASGGGAELSATFEEVFE